MGFSFNQWLAIYEVFKLDQGRVLTLSEVLDGMNPDTADKIAATRDSYKPGPYSSDPLIASIIGLKPVSIVRYAHHPENPAAEFVADKLKKDSGNFGRIQAELLSYGIKTRPDFHIIHMDLPGYTSGQLIVGGKKPAEELWDLYKCQYYLDYVSSDDHSNVTPEVMKSVNDMMNGHCEVFCKVGSAGMNCKPLHKRIGQLLGYTDEQVDDFIHNSMQHGYNHIPDVPYPFDLPDALKAIPRKKGFTPQEQVRARKWF
jgi:hypothetical protein